MLTRELMGVLALAILWVNTLLVAGAALGVMRHLVGRLRRMERDGLIEGTAESELAECEVVQVGRKASDDRDRKAILFHDRRHRSRVLGGAVTCGDERLELDAASSVEVWHARDELRTLAEAFSLEEFDAAYAAACRPKGFERTVRAPVGRGRHVWIHGRRVGSKVLPPDEAPLLVSTIDPRAWCRGRVLVLALFIGGVLAIAGGVTALALTPPLFGPVSAAGAVLGLAYFLLVQPAGTAVRDASLVPHAAFLRGSWVKPGSEGSGGADEVDHSSELVPGRSAQQRTPVE